MTTHQMIINELAAAGLQMADLTKAGRFHTLSNGRRIWTQPIVQDEPMEDLFNANQSSLLMTVQCPTCCGPTHTIFTYVHDERRDYRVCDAHRTHERVRVS